MPFPCKPLSRRAFARRAGRLVGAGLASAALPSTLAYAVGREDLPRLLPQLLDLDGDAFVSALDEKLLQRALGARRGWELRPAAGYDFRADLLARGRVSARDLEVFRALREQLETPAVARRAVTVAWHYTWYGGIRRTDQTAEFLGGNYRSADSDNEALFNELKNEFGINVDAVSWISPRVDGGPLRYMRRGYLRAPNVRTRQVALLYESVINLDSQGRRTNFASVQTRGNLVGDFAAMGSFLRRRVRDAGVPVFELDGRPVIFLYASHNWVDDLESNFQFDALDQAIVDAIAAFQAAYGKPPYLVGEEMLLAPGDEFGRDRQRRSRNFDALFVYHHASAPDNIKGGQGVLGAAYLRQQQRLLQRTILESSVVINRFSGQPLLLIPSLAPGFAKVGHPTLIASRRQYEDFLWGTIDFLEARYYPLVENRYPVPVYTVGSWNEEFEGHTLFPFRTNLSVPDPRHFGFDIALALRRVFGWNRDMAGPSHPYAEPA